MKQAPLQLLVLTIALYAWLPAPHVYAGLHPDSKALLDRASGSRDAADTDNGYGARGQDSPLDRAHMDDMVIPILIGVELGDLTDTWGDARSNGRSHEGIDILASRGSFIVSPTDAVVAEIGTYALGGKYVYTKTQGGERLYFAHLDDYARGLRKGKRLNRGDLIGYVGNTGNAAGGPTHLHFTIYRNGAHNPYPRLTRSWTTDERMTILGNWIDNIDDVQERLAFTQDLISRYRDLFEHAARTEVEMPRLVAALLAIPNVESIHTATRAWAVPAFTRDLERGADGNDVVALQTFLIDRQTGAAAIELARTGTTGYFGTLTEQALAEYQRANAISPAVGYLGPKTRAHIATG